jgi:type IV pilus assembly protein PilC
LIVDALNQSAGVTGNILYEKAVMDVAKRVEKGVPVGEALSYYAIFPPLLIQLVKVGEETGKMDENLLKASEYFEDEVGQSVKTLTTAMEPFIMIVLGVGVGFLVFSVITPIYSILNAVQ